MRLTQRVLAIGRTRLIARRAARRLVVHVLRAHRREALQHAHVAAFVLALIQPSDAVFRFQLACRHGLPRFLRGYFAEHLPLRQEPLPQSESELHEPSGELAHLPLRHDAPPQSEFELHEPPSAVAHLPLRQLTPGPQSELELQPPPPAAHLPLRHEPEPQSESELHVPSGELAHLPLRHDAPPQSELELHEPPAAVAHLPLRQLTPGPQSELELHVPLAHALTAMKARTRVAARTRTACLNFMRTPLDARRMEVRSVTTRARLSLAGYAAPQPSVNAQLRCEALAFASRQEASTLGRRGRMFELTTAIEVNAKRSLAFEVLWDAQRYPEFLTDVLDVVVEPGETADVQIVHYTVRAPRRLEYSLRMEAEAPSRIVWSLVNSDLQRHNCGSWVFSEVPDGSLLTLEIQMEFRLPVPEVIMKKLVEFNLPVMMRQVRARIEQTNRALS